MIRAGTGLAAGSDPIECARQAALLALQRIEPAGADAVMVFASGDVAGSCLPMLHAVRKVCGTGALAGCSGVGVLTDEGEIEGRSAVAVLAIASDTLRVTPFFVRDLHGRDEEVGREIGRIVRPLQSHNPLVAIFPDTLCCNPDRLFAGLHEVAGEVTVVGGGAACPSGGGDRTLQFCGGEAHSNAVSGLVLTGRIVSTVGVTQSCLPVGRPWTVTAAEGNAIRALNGRPAVRALMESLSGGAGEVSEDLHRLAAHLFVAFPSTSGGEPARGQYIVRNILGVDPDDGAIFVGREIGIGDTVLFALRDPDGARDDIKAMLEETLPAAGRPDLGLYFNCCARGQGLYGMADIDTAYIRNACAPMPLAGFFGYAEIASLRGLARLHNYSGVMVLVSEAPDEERPAAA